MKLDIRIASVESGSDLRLLQAADLSKDAKARAHKPLVFVLD